MCAAEILVRWPVSGIVRLGTFQDLFQEATFKFQFNPYLIKRKMHVGKLPYISPYNDGWISSSGPFRLSLSHWFPASWIAFLFSSAYYYFDQISLVLLQ